MNVCLICEAPYFVYGKFDPCVYMYFPVANKITKQKQKMRHRADFEANLWPETEDFFFGLKWTYNISIW